MKCKRILTALLAVILLVCSLSPVSLAAKSAKSFSGSRTVEFTFDSSDLDNYANGGRAGVDFYLRCSAPQWLQYSLHGKGQNVRLTFSFEFESYEDYFGKIGTLLTYRPDILHSTDGGLLLVESFDASQLLGNLQQALGQSQQLSQWAKVTKDILTLGEESYDFTGGKVSINTGGSSEIPFRELEITTTEKKNTLSRTILLTVDAEYTVENKAWNSLVRRCKKLGKAVQSGGSYEVQLEITLKATSQQSLTDMTAECLGMPVGLGIRYVEADENGCTYQRTETFLLDGYMEDGGYFYYRYDGSVYTKNVRAVSEKTSVYTDSVYGDDGEEITTEYVVAKNQPSVKFNYTGPFRFDSVTVDTEWDSVFRKISRTVTLTAPTFAAETYHERIKDKLSDRIVKGTTLDIYDQDQVRYYVLSYASWRWGDVKKFTGAILDCEITHENSWVPFGLSSYTEKLGSANVIKDFGAAHRLEVRYSFPGETVECESGTEKKGVLLFRDTEETLQFTYKHLHILKLLFLLAAAAALVLTVLHFAKKLLKIIKEKLSEKKAKKAAQKAAKEAAKKNAGAGTAVPGVTPETTTVTPEDAPALTSEAPQNDADNGAENG